MTRKILVCAVLFFLAAGRPAQGAERDSKLRSFTVSRGGMLTVSLSVGDIRVKTWDKNEVTVQARDLDEDEADALDVRQRGNTIEVRYDPEWGWSGEGRVEISIPANFNANLQTAGGDIIVTGNLTGRIEAATSGGDVRVADVVGPVDMNTAGGDMRTGDVDGDLKLNTSGGDIIVGAVTGIADVRTSGGEVRIARADKSLRVATSGGNVVVGDVGGELSAVTLGGDITAGKIGGGVELKTSGGNITLRGAGGSVTARTAGGDIRLEGVTGPVTAKSAAGNIRVEMNPGGTGRSKISSSVGDIRLVVPENAKASITARIRIKGMWKVRGGDVGIFSDFKEDTYDEDESLREMRASYTLNGGGASITLDATFGTIEIRKAGSGGSRRK